MGTRVVVFNVKHYLFNIPIMFEIYVYVVTTNLVKYFSVFVSFKNTISMDLNIK